MTTEGLLLDIDGVLTQGAPDALPTLAARVLFRVVTNSSQRSCATLTGNLTALGFDVGPEAIFTPARAAARHLKDRSATAYLATREDARTQFLELGVVIYDGQPDFVWSSVTSGRTSATANSTTCSDSSSAAPD